MRNVHTPKNFGAIVASVLNELRKSKKIEIKDIVNKLELSSGTVYDIFNGKNVNPSFYNVFLIVTAGMELKFKKFADLLEHEKDNLK